MFLTLKYHVLSDRLYRFSTRYKAFLSEILGFSKLCCTRQRFLNRCKPLSFTVDLFLLLMACLVQHSFEKPRVSDKNADHLSTFLGFGTPEPGPVMNKFRSSKPILSSQNSFQNHGSGHVQKLPNCQWMTARCRNVVTFRVFWEDFNTFEANQSRRGIQKWSLGGKLIYSTTNLSKTEDLYKNIDHLSKIVGFGTPEPGPVMNKFRSSKPDSELSRFVPKPRIRSCSKIIKLPVNGSMLPKYYIDFRTVCFE